MFFCLFSRKYVPELKDFPDDYIYEPWKTPLEIQRRSHCIVGADYPQPMINHEDARRECVTKLRGVYQTLVCKGEGYKILFSSYKSSRNGLKCPGYKQ